ncbi:MAG TPA: LytTR family DNA-binding domain-containing protein [Candidatus Eremiobacteraceae bacterium]|nr:LytTR family DNA-binding domain-containing protein [Candidatus Eremiobacteraceae bacterium]HXZ39580.1 LytTR family DNA-binding domain-containing protein [Terriglobales bacterium]
MTIRALIVDDEPLARRSIRRFLDKGSGVEIIDQCGDGNSAVEAIRTQKPDLVFLDVQMPEKTGLDVIREIGPDAMPVTVFVTAYDRYAIRAFDANAIDYLLKPFAKQRFDMALKRAKERIAGRMNLNDLRAILASLECDQTQSAYLDRLTASENGRILLINVKDIDWIGTSGNYAHVYSGSRKYEIRQTLTSLEEKLNPRDFLRIHRSTIVNIRRIREIQPWFHGYHLIILQNGQELRMSRYQRDVAKRLGISQ